MRLHDALSGVIALGIDTPPFIYFIERNATYLPLVREAIRRIDAGTPIGYSSVITLTEVLTQPRRTGNVTIETEYRTLLLHSRNFTLVPITAAVADQAADLRARYQLRTPDALQIAAALSAGCDAFLTNDHALRRVGELSVLVLDDMGL